MRQGLKKAVAAILVVAAVAAANILIDSARPLVTAPKGTAPLDNTIDTADAAHLVVDEAGVLAEEVERIIAIYNANWYALAGRMMAVVTVEHTENAEDDAWKRADQLALGENDALLLIESQGAKQCVLVSDGTFREDIATLSEVFLTQLTYMSLRAGEFDAAVLTVFERFHYFYGYDVESHRQAVVREGLTTFCIIAALMLPILIHMVGEIVDRRRFKRWYDDYGVNDPSVVPWRTVFFWHRAGSKWYEQRVSGEWVDIHAGIVSSRRDQKTRWYRRR